MRNRAAVVAALAFFVMLGFVVLTPWLSSQDPYAVDFSHAYLWPSWAHPFGTDEFGRDLFVRTALGGRVSIEIGFVATIAIMIVGILYGAVSGFAGGWLDNADALPGRALRPAVPALRHHHADDLRDGQLLDDGRRPDGRRRGSRPPA